MMADQAADMSLFPGICGQDILDPLGDGIANVVPDMPRLGVGPVLYLPGKPELIGMLQEPLETLPRCPRDVDSQTPPVV